MLNSLIMCMMPNHSLVGTEAKAADLDDRKMRERNSSGIIEATNVLTVYH